MLAFFARAAVALAGDFVMQPDEIPAEIMQYLEPAHRLVFGNGAAFWEYIYGARSWLVAGLVAGVLANSCQSPTKIGRPGTLPRDNQDENAEAAGCPLIGGRLVAADGGRA